MNPTADLLKPTYSRLYSRAFFAPAFLSLLGALMLASSLPARAQSFYVANGDNIDKISAGSLSVFATLPSGSEPAGMAVDASGNLYVVASGSSLSEIYKITTFGAVSPFAALPFTLGTTGDCLAIDGSGNLFASDAATGNIVKISTSGVVSSFATLPGAGISGLAFDNSGNLFAANNSGVPQVDKIFPNGGVTAYSALPANSEAVGIVSNGSGDLFVGGVRQDTSGTTSFITEIVPGEPVGTASTFSTLFSGGHTSGDDPSGGNIDGLAIDGSGNLYATDSAIGTIYEVTPAGAASTYLSGFSLEFAPTSILAIPEPSSAISLALGVTALLGLRLRRPAQGAKIV